jgi:hypothetical protein
MWPLVQLERSASADLGVAQRCHVQLLPIFTPNASKYLSALEVQIYGVGPEMGGIIWGCERVFAG